MLAAETTGNPCLHASGVRIGNGTILFVANKGEGKSLPCCALTEHGYPLVADDIAPIARKNRQFQVLCAESRIKLWPDRTGMALPPLHGIVFIQRDNSASRQNDTTLPPLKQRDALLELHKHLQISQRLRAATGGHKYHRA